MSAPCRSDQNPNGLFMDKTGLNLIVGLVKNYMTIIRKVETIVIILPRILLVHLVE
jgi:hypothetical protein